MRVASIVAFSAITSVMVLNAGQVQPTPAQPAAVSTPAPPAQVITLPANTELVIRTIDPIDSKSADEYREYSASLDEAVSINGLAVLPARTSVVLKLSNIQQAGFKRRASLSIGVVALTVSGQRVNIETSKIASQGAPQGKKTAKDAAIGGAAGLVVGGLIFGRVGAGVGAIVGAGGGALVSKFMGKGVEIPAESLFAYKLTQPIVINYQPSPAPAVAALPGAGSQPAAVPSLLPRSAESASVAKPTEVITAEPDLIGVVYLHGDGGKLIPLMRVTGEQGGVHPVWAPAGALIFKPPPSAVRVKAGQKMSFVVRMADGVDPGAFSLVSSKPAKRGEKQQQQHLHLSITKFAGSSYTLTPDSDLVPGEYAFHGRYSSDFYCVGVDEAEAASPKEPGK